MKCSEFSERSSRGGVGLERCGTHAEDFCSVSSHQRQVFLIGADLGVVFDGKPDTVVARRSVPLSKSK